MNPLWKINKSSEWILLSVKHEPCYGAEISRKIAEASSFQCFLTAGNLYPLLKQLEDTGFIESYQKNEFPSKARRGRMRKYYRITAAGLAALKELQLMRDQLDYSCSPC
ncbi:MAG: PadR family transcriptional regulator [Leptolyngbya sp. SIO4C1]|nr:PadR family transcriptional regulator [Leptolyngbya sp. SIO4C1]